MKYTQHKMENLKNAKSEKVTTIIPESGMRYIILISGWCGSGKDTIADYLVDKFKFLKISIADDLKRKVAKKYNFDHSLTQSQKGKQTTILYTDGNKTVRDLLIYEAYRRKQSHGNDTFIKTVSKNISEIDYIQHHMLINSSYENQISNQLSNIICKHIVIPDFRFKHEYEHMYDSFHGLCKYGVINNVVTLRVNRFDKHPVDSFSEKDLDDFNFDFVLENNADIRSLNKEINAVINNVFYGCESK